MEPRKFPVVTRNSDPDLRNGRGRISSFPNSRFEEFSFTTPKRTYLGEDIDELSPPDLMKLHTEPLNPDATECEDCAIEFGVFLKRHYCERCGKALCEECSIERRHFEKDENNAFRLCYFCSQKCEHAEMENAFIRALHERENIVESLREKISTIQNQKEEKEDKLDELEIHSTSVREKEHEKLYNLKKSLHSLNRATLKATRVNQSKQKFLKEQEMELKNKTMEVEGIKIRQLQFQTECKEMEQIISELQQRKGMLQQRLEMLKIPLSKVQPLNFQSVAIQNIQPSSEDCQQAFSHSMVSVESHSSISTHDSAFHKAESKKESIPVRAPSKKGKSSCNIF